MKSSIDLGGSLKSFSVLLEITQISGGASEVVTRVPGSGAPPAPPPGPAASASRPWRAQPPGQWRIAAAQVVAWRIAVGPWCTLKSWYPKYRGVIHTDVPVTWMGILLYLVMKHFLHPWIININHQINLDIREMKSSSNW